MALETPPWGWMEFVSPGSGQRNICPTYDIGPHCLDEVCHCGAEMDEDGLLVHNALDGREDYEQGRRARH